MARSLKKSNLKLINVHANVDGTNIDTGEYIIKQSRARGYEVVTPNGKAVCDLVASDTPAKGQLYMVATDSDGNTYWIIKLTRHRATLVQRSLATVGGAYQFASMSAATHDFGAAPVAGKSVQLQYA